MIAEERQLEKNTEVWGGLLPKVETQGYDFLKKNPTMDGRGIVVAVLDTGVDPGAIGLQTTSEGLPKVIDIIDCTGSGDVTMHGLLEADLEGQLKGLSGRTITVNPAWKNPTGKYRVGVKKLNELYTPSLRDRMKKHRKDAFETRQQEQEKIIKEKISQLSAGGNGTAGGDNKADLEDLTAQLATLREMGGPEESQGNCGSAVLDCVVFHDGERWLAVVDSTGTGDMSAAAPMADYDYKQEFRAFSKHDSFNFGIHVYDEGKILSIVVDSGAHGTHVAGIIAAHHPNQPEINGVAPGAQIVSLKIGDSRLDSSETAPGLIRALLEAIRLKVHIINMSFGEAAQYDNTGAFVKLAEEMVYKHGITFVSSAGNNGPNLSTVGAPMASCIISVGAFVTKSLMRTAYSIKETHIENIPESNFTWSSVGPVADGDMGVSLMAPGGAITCVPNWTLSRNQLMNGTSMSSPNACGCFTLLLSGLKQHRQQNEKSSSVGGPFIVSPPRLRLAVENECKYIDEVDVHGQNNGLVQVERAWNNLMANMNDSSLDIPIRFEVMSRRFTRGIYLRQPSESAVSSTFKVEVKPAFALLPQDEGAVETSYFRGKTIQQAKIDYEMRLHLVSSCDWVTAPERVLLVQAGKVISVHVDPTKLSPGVHVEFIRAYDENNPKKGCVFKIPITVIKPEVMAPLTVSHTLGTNLQLPPTDRIRRFIVPPPGCSFMDVVVHDKRVSSSSSSLSIEDGGEGGETLSPAADDSSARMVVVHAVQLLPGEPYRDHEKQQYLHLAPGSEHSVSFAVEPNITLELTLSRFWSTLGAVLCDVTVLFRGVTPIPTSVNVYQGQKANSRCSRVRLQADLHPCSVLPSATVNTWSRTITPNALASDTAVSRISPLGERDVKPKESGGVVYSYQLVLEYSFEIEEAGKNNTVIPRWPVWNEILYESPFSGQFYMIYDSQKQLVSCGDAYASRASVALSKGHYTARLQVRHDDAALLESYVNTPMVLERKLSSSIKVPCFATQADALLSSALSAEIPLFLGTSCSVVFGAPDSSSLPKTVRAGDFFQGSVTYLKKPASLLGSGTRPGGYPVTFFCTETTTAAAAAKPTAAVKSPPMSDSPAEKKSEEEREKVTTTPAEEDAAPQFEMDEALLKVIREAKLKYLSGVGQKEVSKDVLSMTLTDHPFYKMYSYMLVDYPQHIPLRLVALEYFVKCATNSAAAKSGDNTVQLQKYISVVVTTSDEICAMIDTGAITAELGLLSDPNDSQAVERRKQVMATKEQLIKALSAKCHMLILETNRAAAGVETSAIAADGEKNAVLFSNTYKELSKWEDVEKSDTNWELVLHKNNTFKRYGLSLKRINELLAKEKLSSQPSTPLTKKLTEARTHCLRCLGWEHIINRMEAENTAKNYDQYLPF